MRYITREEKQKLVEIAFRVRNRARCSFDLANLVRRELAKERMYRKDFYYYVMGILRKSKAIKAF